MGRAPDKTETGTPTIIIPLLYAYLFLQVVLKVVLNPAWEDVCDNFD